MSARFLFLSAILGALGCGTDSTSTATAPDASIDSSDGTSPDGGDKPPLHVLFIGNSYTYVNDLPSVVHALGAATPGAAIEVDSVTEGAARLSTLWEAGVARARIESGGFDAVVLQGNSLEATGTGSIFYPYARLFGDAVRNAGARPIWFATWARHPSNSMFVEQTTPDFMTRVIDHAYRTAAQVSGGTVARVGKAWQLALAEQPNVELYDPDGSHPSPAGTLLAACTIFHAITGREAVVPDPAPLGIDRSIATALCALAPRVQCELESCPCETAEKVTTTYTELRNIAPACDGTTERLGIACNGAMNATCAARACTSGGFGPASSNGDAVDLTCVAGTELKTTFTALRALDPMCNGIAERNGPHCAMAIDRACAATGALSGFGPTAIAGDEVTVTCVSAKNAHRARARYNLLKALNNECDEAAQPWGAGCNTAIDLHCQSLGFAGGFGPIGPPDPNESVPENGVSVPPPPLVPAKPVTGAFANFVCVSW